MKSSSKKVTYIFITITLLFFIGHVSAQEIVVPNDSINESIKELESIEKVANPHMPNKATMYSAVLPGLGQIYNKQWWKVPFIYGGFVGFSLGISWNQTQLSNAKQYYFDITDKNPETKSYEDKWPDVDFSNPNTKQNYTANFKSAISGYRRQRDLVILGTVGFYLFNILDANVRAHLIDFDVSENLAINFEPIAIDPMSKTPIFGTRLVYTF